ncbi:hypothetical protein AG1IA_02284 [Rhizoctonia solani AG-1 IA]|uniref:Uncharacterized protein n=1 Tax=Thanatephorus cucumeris (strain AG1-IA) TaxID=983506 RepID=L8X3S7_THACA|nr:hypothetical protein AG1IA_02284 [Rhizoctonia solani AG-1 IA]
MVNLIATRYNIQKSAADKEYKCTPESMSLAHDREEYNYVVSRDQSHPWVFLSLTTTSLSAAYCDASSCLCPCTLCSCLRTGAYSHNRAHFSNHPQDLGSKCYQHPADSSCLLCSPAEILLSLTLANKIPPQPDDSRVLDDHHWWRCHGDPYHFAAMFLMRVRAQRRMRNNRSWAIRPGGWIDESKQSYPIDLPCSCTLSHPSAFVVRMTQMPTVPGFILNSQIGSPYPADRGHSAWGGAD